MRNHLLFVICSCFLFFSCHKSDSISKSETNETLAKLVAETPKAIYIDGTKKTITTVKRNGEKLVVRDVYSSTAVSKKSTIGDISQVSLQAKSFLPFGAIFKASNARAATDGTENGGGPDLNGLIETHYDAVATKVNNVYVGASGYTVSVFPTNGSYVNANGSMVYYNITVCCVTGSFAINGSGSAIHIYWTATRTISYTVNGVTNMVSSDIHNDAWF